MTSKERVKRAVLFEGPDRIPYTLPDKWGSDITMVGCAPDPDWQPSIDTDTKWEDEWGCIWEKLSGDVSMGQVTHNPLKDYSDLDSFPFPDYSKPERYESIRKAVQENTDEKFVLAGIPFSLIHRLEYLRGHEGAWTDPMMYSSELNSLLDHLSSIAMEAIDHLADIGVDGIFSCDDWGLQDRLMVNPKTWHEFWKPQYKKVYTYAREKGLLTFLHSCGYITDILDGLIEANLNVIQMDQQENMGVENLSRRFGGRLCFWCPVDIQKTMNKGSVEDVREYARKLIDELGKFNGGFIAKWYPSPEAAGHSWDKIDAMCETFIEYGSRFYNSD
jgi:uroporphyrinogen-III decarboxylase